MILIIFIIGLYIGGIEFQINYDLTIIDNDKIYLIENANQANMEKYYLKYGLDFNKDYERISTFSGIDIYLFGFKIL